MRHFVLGAIALAAFPLVGAQAASLSKQDQTFINQAAIGGMAEVQAGQLAQTKGQSPDVKAFGAHMVQEHTPNNQQLMGLASQKGMTPPTALDTRHQAMTDKLQADSPTAFDADYIKGQVTGHQQMARVMNMEIKNGRDPDLKAFATQTLPVVQQHLQMAKQLQAQMKG